MTDTIATKGLPIKGSLRLPTVASLLVAALMLGLSLFGVLNPNGIYPTEENRFVLLPNDMVNLVLCIPLILVSIVLARRGSLIGLLCLPGSLFFSMYTYLPYVVYAPFDALYPARLALFALALYTLIGTVIRIDGEAVKSRLAGRVHEKLAAGILIALIFFTFARQGGVIIDRLSKGLPATIQLYGEWMNDFTAMPAVLICGIALWRKKPLGYVGAAGALLAYGALSIGLVPFLLIQGELKHTAFDPATIFIVTVMAALCLVPFAFFARAAK